MFGSRGRGSAILEALRQARQEEKEMELQQLRSGSKKEPPHGSSSSSSMESIVASTNKMTLCKSSKWSQNVSSEESSTEMNSDPQPTHGYSSRERRPGSLQNHKAEVPKAETRHAFKRDSSVELGENERRIDKASWYGTSGQKINLLSNCIKLQVSAERRREGFICHQVRFEPELDSKFLRRKLLSSQRDVIGPAFVFDGFTLYLPYRCDHKELDSRNKKYKMTIKYFRKKEYNTQESTVVYNLLLKQVCSSLNMVQIRRNSFLPSKAMKLDKHGLEVWPGYVTSVSNYGASGLLLLIDMKSKVLRTQTVHNIIKDLISNPGYGSNDVKVRIKKALIGEVVMTKYNNKTYRIDDVDFDSNPLSTFELNGKKESYEGYYSLQYQINIKDHKQPLLIHYPKAPRIISDHTQENYNPISLIPELCYMTGLSDRMRNNFTLMKDLAALTKMSPRQRKVTLEKLLQEINSKEETRDILGNWGISLAQTALPLEGRVLEPSILTFGNGYQIETTTDFSKDCMNNSVIGPVDISNWILIFDSRNQDVSKNFVSTMLSRSIYQNLGIKVSEPKRIILHGSRTEEFSRKIRQSLNADSSIQLVVTIVDSPKSDLYSAVKKICCVEKAVASQFILKKSLNHSMKSQSIIRKIALQIVCKLGGELWAGQSPYKNAMIVGIDAYHDPNRQHRSCLGFVASLNKTYSRWSSYTERNTDHQEISPALGRCLKRAIQEYIEHNGEAPSRVVVYRDGVGDGRMSMIEEYEAPQMLKVCESFNRGMDSPMKLTVIVVSKKVNTRVICVSREGSSNPPPGTVVDHSITENRVYPNFFLVSQKVGEGTVAPTHYIMAYDNSNMSAEHAQKLSYRLTFMYYNWPGSIRVPVPCLLAHKIAGLVGEYIGTETNPALSDKLFYL